MDAVIAREPANITALVRKADLRADAGDERTATAFYRAALRVAAQQGWAAPEVRPALARAKAESERALLHFQDYLEARLDQAGLDRSNRPPRFQESIDILMGRREVNLELQRPKAYYFPGLPQRCYYERSEFEWAAEVEQQVDPIRREALALASDETRFRPYLTSDPNRPPIQVHSLMDNPDWSTLPLWENGSPVEDSVARCPATFKVLRQLDLAFISTRAPWVVFSKLKPGARIPAHTGYINARLICHLPLVVPKGCAFKVGEEVRPWREGELMIFDDTVTHEAWNDGASDRIVLIFDIWRPELSLDERQAVSAIFEAIDSYQS